MTASRTRARGGSACSLGLLALAASLAAAGPAHAGQLTVHAGALPDGTPAVAGPWSGLTVGAPGATGTFGVSASLLTQGASQTASLAAPPNLVFASATVRRRLAAPISGDHSQPQIATTWESRGYPYRGLNGTGGYLGDEADGSVTVANPVALSVRLTCVNFDGVPGTCAGVYHLIDRLELVLRDDEAPAVTGTMSGALLDGAWKTAPAASVSVTASDVGAGVYRAFLRTGTQTVYAAIDPAATRCRDVRPNGGTAYDFVPSALTLVPCPTVSATYSPAFDLSGLGDGVHSVAVGIEDASGNERTVVTNQALRVNLPGGTLGDPGTACGGGGTYDVAGVCQPPSGGGGGGGTGGSGGVVDVPARTAAPAPSAAPPVTPPAVERRGNGTGASAAATLTVRAEGATGARVSIAYGAPLVVTGRLAAPGGGPIAGASIAVSSGRPGAVQAETPAVTGADGTFRAVVPPGVSRTVRFSYRAFADDAHDADATQLEVGVRAAATLRVTPRRLRNGRTVVFRGRVPGAPAGSRKVVEMQVHQDGRWLTFATTRLQNGGFSHRYRFTRTRSTTRYVFRTIVRTDAGWPYETGVSNRVSVEVRP